MRAKEKEILNAGYKFVAGIDEAGRGPLAGPVVAAACILPANFRMWYLNDSKQVPKDTREKLYKKLTTHPEIFYGVGMASEKEIDEINIHQASLLAMKRALEALTIKPDYIIADGRHLPEMPDAESFGAKAIVKGDADTLSIAAASIIAKYTRDKIMDELHDKYPQYLFNQHKGYGTRLHLEMLQLHGPSPIHRYSFEPVRLILEGKELDLLGIEEVKEKVGEVSEKKSPEPVE